MKDISIIKMQIKNTRFTGIPFQSNFIILLLVALLLFGLCACSHQAEPADIVVEYTVPFAESGTRWNEVVLLENDDFGRQLYRYKSEGQHTNVFSDFVEMDTSNKPVLVYILVQSYDNTYVYCYDDMCYMYTASFEQTDVVALDSFKQENDWNKPLNKNRMIAYSRDRESISSLPLLMKDEKASALGEALGRTIDKHYVSAIYTPQLEPIYVLREVEEWNTTKTDIVFGKSYVFILDDKQTVVRCEELTGSIEQWRDQISAFKDSCYNTKNSA